MSSLFFSANSLNEFGKFIEKIEDHRDILVSSLNIYEAVYFYFDKLHSFHMQNRSNWPLSNNEANDLFSCLLLIMSDNRYTYKALSNKVLTNHKV